MAYPTNGSAHNKTQRAREDEHEGENLYFSKSPWPDQPNDISLNYDRIQNRIQTR